MPRLGYVASYLGPLVLVTKGGTQEDGSPTSQILSTFYSIVSVLLDLKAGVSGLITLVHFEEGVSHQMSWPK